MQVRTVLAVLAALLLLVAIVPQAPRSGHVDVAGDGHGAASPAIAVDREGPGDETGMLPDERDRAHGEAAGDEAPDDRSRAVEDAAGDEAPHDRSRRSGYAAGERVPHDGPDRAGSAVDVDDDHAAARDDPQVIYRYDVETRGEVTTDAETFTRTTARILTDPRGWTLGGRIAFERAADDHDFTVVLATPQEVAAAHEDCVPEYSCRVEDEILVNDRNWRDATSAWQEAGGDLATYRRYLINHEVGHFLGFGHVDCGGAGERAPVMQQQSVSTQACEPNGWPLEWEREQLAQQLDAPERE